MTNLLERLQLLPSNVVETLSPEQRQLLLKELGEGKCHPENGPKTEPLKGPEDLQAIITTILRPTEQQLEPVEDEKLNAFEKFTRFIKGRVWFGFKVPKEFDHIYPSF